MDARRPQPDRRRGTLVSAGEFLRWLLLLLLITACLGLAAMQWIQIRLDEVIRQHVEKRFRDHYSTLAVSIKSARRLPQGGIEIRGISIADPTDAGGPTLLAHLDELRVDCDTRLDQLLAADREVRQLVVRRLVINATRLTDGSWDAARLLPLPKFGPRPPPVVIESGKVQLREGAGETQRRWGFHDINLRTRPRTIGASDPAQLPRLEFEGHFSSDVVSRVQCRGEFDLASNDWTATGTANQLRLSPETFAQLPTGTSTKLALLQSLQGTADFAYELSSGPVSGLPFAFKVKGRFAGQIDHQQLPRPLRDVQLPFWFDNHSLTVNEASAQFGGSTLSGSYHRGGWSEGSPCSIHLVARRFVIDQALRGALRGDWQRQWDRFAPAGVVDAEAILRFDGNRWLQKVTVDCLAGSFAYEKFPYRLTDVQGRIECREDRILIGSSDQKIRGLAGGSVVEIGGTIENPGGEATGWIDVQTLEPIPLDERLIEALPDKAEDPGSPRGKSPRDVVRSLHPQGSIHVSARYGKDAAAQPLQKQLSLKMHNCSIWYDKFQYPIYEIGGEVAMENDRWTVKELRGANDSGVIDCNGNWHSEATGGCQLNLQFLAWDVPLDDELRDALTPSAQRIWRQLQPRGTVDQLEVGLNYRSRSGALDIEVTGHKRPAGGNIEGRSISLTPSWLPYQLDHVTGEFKVAQGVTRLKNMRAWHGDSEFGLDGFADSPAPGTWRLLLERVYANRVRATHELIAALPRRWGAAISELKLFGPLGVSGRIELGGAHGEDRPRVSQWDLSIVLENGRVECGIPFEHIRGEVGLKGQHGPNGVSGIGQLQIDSMVIKGVQLTDIKGPLTFDSTRLQFGAQANRALLRIEPPPLAARAFAGVVGSSGVIDFESGSFLMNASLNHGSLSSIYQEVTAGRSPSPGQPTGADRNAITGLAFGAVELHGTSRGVHTLGGDGVVQLREANIYKLPLMLSLLKLLSIRDPDQTAFTSSDLEFRLEGDRVYFDRIDFDGDAISLEGRGELGFDQELNLTFDTSLGRDDSQLLSRILRPILKEAGRRLVSIKVTGTLQEPLSEPIALPELNEGIQRVFPDTAHGPRNANPR